MSKYNLRMPAEWEEHDASWIAWPHERSDWPGRFEIVDWTYVEIARALSQSEITNIVYQDETQLERITYCLRHADTSLENIRFHHFKTDRSWLRDSAGIGVQTADNTLAWLDWHFNAWAKYDNFQNDSLLSKRISECIDSQHIEVASSKNSSVVLEGGAIDVDGSGTALVTEECLLSEVQCRNQGFTKADYEQIFLDYLGITKTIWLKSGILGDDTHGHIDDITRFVNSGVVVTAIENDPQSPNYEILRENISILKDSKDANGNDLIIHCLPMPKNRTVEGEMLPASYANFYIANTVVIVPTFNDPNDRIALNTLQSIFPNRDVIGIACHDLVLGQGTLHCLTQQQPRPQKA